MPTFHPPLDEDFNLGQITTYQAGVLQSAFHRALTKKTSEALAKFGITAMQWFIIGTILDAGPTGMRITDLGKQVGTNLPFLTNTINILESKGILQKVDHAEDKRALMVSVAPAFIPTCKVIETELRTALRTAIYAKITPEELTTYMGVLSKLRDIT